MFATLNNSETFRVLSLNLRYDSQPDRQPVSETIKNLPDPLRPRQAYYHDTDERPWSERRIAVANEVLFNNVDLIGFQEALERQVKDLHQLLGLKEWGWAGVGRDDGDVGGEYSPIFYKKSKLTLKYCDTFWLSNQPFICGSRYPGAGSVRICTVARFITSSGGTLTVMATHWDDQSDLQRQLAASLILHRAHHESVKNGSEVILLGDFNSPGTGRDSGGYDIITGARSPLEINGKFKERYPVDNNNAFKMVDFLSRVPRQFVSGHHGELLHHTRVP
ncbi:hypothetical protein Clacol_004876 [Clathrus columnatus]|uniref:Endonuclease/exonuclease/phosphatase domain-containing protein n=1 Tax=Clathrus columnatus TaxID=1419009 RepID=A0AAV5A7Q5_9AGAM|nr:hypothetical protein Clacol_004876 [Clathrus columnatus]